MKVNYGITTPKTPTPSTTLPTKTNRSRIKKLNIKPKHPKKSPLIQQTNKTILRSP
jgi:hypothetical protein